MVAVPAPAPLIRPMAQDDLIGVLAQERAGYGYPWSRRIFEDCLRVGYCCLVAEVEQRVAGHGIMMSTAGEAHILNICVATTWRRCGIARQLLEALLDVAVRAGADTAFLEVRPSNPGAVVLYERAGFHEVARRPDYYPASFGREEAIVMARGLAPTESDGSASQTL